MLFVRVVNDCVQSLTHKKNLLYVLTYDDRMKRKAEAFQEAQQLEDGQLAVLCDVC